MFPDSTLIVLQEVGRMKLTEGRARGGGGVTDDLSPARDRSASSRSTLASKHSDIALRSNKGSLHPSPRRPAVPKSRTLHPAPAASTHSESHCTAPDCAALRRRSQAPPAIDIDEMTGCADDQTFVGVPAEAFREALRRIADG